MSDALKLKIADEFLNRSRSGTIFHILLALLLGATFSDSNPKWWSVAVILIIVFAFGRGVAQHLNSKSKDNKRFLLNLMYFCLYFSALTWGLLVAWSLEKHGVFSVQSLSSIFILSGLFAGSVHFLCLYKWVHIIYASLLSFPSLYVVYSRIESKEYLACSIIFTLMFIFIAALSRNQNKDIINNLRTEIELNDALHALKIQTAKAEHSSRLATLGEMASGIAHEINNPLTIIIANASQILKKNPENQYAKVRLEKIISTSHRISKIIHGLKLFSRQSDLDPMEDFALQELIQDSLELCQEKFNRYNVTLKAEPTPDVLIHCRPAQISQVLLNLLNNAFDATLEGPEKKIEVNYKIVDNFLQIYISDSGPGIPAHVVDKIFNPFFTTKDIGKGTGLGLSISKGIIADHKGELTLVTNAPKTTFLIQLPCKLLHRNSNDSLAA